MLLRDRWKGCWNAGVYAPPRTADNADTRPACGFARARNARSSGDAGGIAGSGDRTTDDEEVGAALDRLGRREHPDLIVAVGPGGSDARNHEAERLPQASRTSRTSSPETTTRRGRPAGLPCERCRRREILTCLRREHRDRDHEWRRDTGLRGATARPGERGPHHVEAAERVDVHHRDPETGDVRARRSTVVGMSCSFESTNTGPRPPPGGPRPDRGPRTARTHLEHPDLGRERVGEPLRAREIRRVERHHEPVPRRRIMRPAPCLVAHTGAKEAEPAGAPAGRRATPRSSPSGSARCPGRRSREPQGRPGWPCRLHRPRAGQQTLHGVLTRTDPSARDHRGVGHARAASNTARRVIGFRAGPESHPVTRRFRREPRRVGAERRRRPGHGDTGGARPHRSAARRPRRHAAGSFAKTGTSDIRDTAPTISETRST